MRMRALRLTSDINTFGGDVVLKNISFGFTTVSHLKAAKRSTFRTCYAILVVVPALY